MYVIGFRLADWTKSWNLEWCRPEGAWNMGRDQPPRRGVNMGDGEIPKSHFPPSRIENCSHHDGRNQEIPFTFPLHPDLSRFESVPVPRCQTDVPDWEVIPGLAVC